MLPGKRCGQAAPPQSAPRHILEVQPAPTWVVAVLSTNKKAASKVLLRPASCHHSWSFPVLYSVRHTTCKQQPKQNLSREESAAPAASSDTCAEGGV